jgi:outer membrane protein OmpA-like peptidoglycan-associated protein
MVYYGVSNVRLTVPQNREIGLGVRLFQWSVSPVFHFTDRTARVRPYFYAGYGRNRYYPTRDAVRQAESLAASDPALAFLAPFDATETLGTFNYGLGVKLRMGSTGKVGLRFDARGLISQRPKWGISTSDENLYGWQPTVGLNFWFGKQPRDREYERTITITETRTVTNNTISLGQLQGAGEVCGGTPINLSLTATTVPANVPLQYQWAVNGTNTGGNQNTLAFTPPDAGGNQTVTVTITDTSTGATRAQPATITQTIRVRPYVRPTVTATASAREVLVTDPPVTLTSSSQGDCGGALTTTWTASEGRLTANGNNATFDPSSVAFGAAGLTDQVKQITLTATTRDTRNQTGTSNVQLTVRRRAVAVQLADILFARGSTRVNNCGQRILTDDVYPQFRSGYQIVLVGHTDAGDPRTANLDRNRAYAVGRLLASGGRSPRNTIDIQNIKVDWVGNEQTAPKNSRQCEASVREAPGNAISANDAAAANRRVEVWLVPMGATMPTSVKAAKDLPPR